MNMQINTTWKSIPTLKTLKVREYGSVNVAGAIAYKIGRHSRADIDRAVASGYREVGAGSSYVYISRGEPSKVRDQAQALVLSSGYSIEPNGNEHRVTLYTSNGPIYSRTGNVPDVPALKARLESMGKREVQL